MLRSRHVPNSWAGLVTYVENERPVVGIDVAAPGFFWLVGQGSSGIMTAPAIARVAAAVVTEARFPTGFESLEISAELLSPGRLSTA